ncbi:MAG: hypothetical protein V1717_03445 [Candidatus Micrarchaeota archaeon]
MKAEVLAFVLVSLLFAGCLNEQSSPSPTPTLTPTSTPVVSATPIPTATATPTPVLYPGGKIEEAIEKALA